MTLLWKFDVDKKPQTAEWRDGAMRCTMPEVIAMVDALITAGDKLPCGSATLMVTPTLENEAGAYAVISEAVWETADFLTIKFPQSEATITTDVVLPEEDDLEKAKSFGGDRSAAAAYAANMRWGNRFDPLAVREVGGHALEQHIDSLYPHKEDEDFPFNSSQAAAVLDYTEQGWDINNSLRQQAANDPRASSEHSGTIKQIDSAFDSAEPLTDAVVLHRGLGVSPKDATGSGTMSFFSGLKVGQSFSDPAFSSTSTHEKISSEYAVGSKIRFKIVVPAGKKVLPINTVLGKKNHYFGEHEVLLPRGSKFKVVEIINETWSVDMGVGRTIKVVME
jgi:hypothetical protein